MNKQEAFNEVWTKLKTQGRQSAYRDRCVYRTADGRKCAVGHLMRDEIYESRFDLMGASFRGIEAVMTDLDLPTTFLVDLQKAHDQADGADFVKDLRSNMLTLASTWELDAGILARET